MKEHSTITFLQNFQSEKKIFFEICDVKNSKFYKECMGSLALLPPKNFAFLDEQYLTDYCMQTAKVWKELGKLSRGGKSTIMSPYILCKISSF